MWAISLNTSPCVLKNSELLHIDIALKICKNFQYVIVSIGKGRGNKRKAVFHLPKPQGPALRPGELDEKALLEITGASKVTLCKWRKNDGLPFEKRGKFVVYQEAAVRDWMKQRVMAYAMLKQGDAIKAFVKDFKAKEEEARLSLRQSRAVLAAALFVKQGKAGPEVEEQLNDAVAKAERKTRIAFQSLSLYRLACSLEETRIKNIAAAAFDIEAARRLPAISEENKALAVQIMLAMFPKVTGKDAQEMLKSIDALHELNQKKLDGTATDEDADNIVKAMTGVSGRR